MPSNCLTLSPNYACALCQYGYYLSNGICLACRVELGTVLSPLFS
jgi:hypothetical protein